MDAVLEEMLGWLDPFIPRMENEDDFVRARTLFYLFFFASIPTIALAFFFSSPYWRVVGSIEWKARRQLWTRMTADWLELGAGDDCCFLLDQRKSAARHSEEGRKVVDSRFSEWKEEQVGKRAATLIVAVVATAFT